VRMAAVAALTGIDPLPFLRAADPVEQMLLEAVLVKAMEIREDALREAATGG
jgi:hypothetical protein